MLKFNVTYEIMTPESAEYGDADERGFIVEGASLRDALDYVFSTRTSQCEGVEAVEANEYPVVSPGWITVYNGIEYLTGAHESRSIHFPDNMTASSRVRVARLMQCTGA